MNHVIAEWVQSPILYVIILSAGLKNLYKNPAFLLIYSIVAKTGL